jgi:predicted AAA+ superfamily ATPase
MYLQRTIDVDLLDWKQSDLRKPLLIRGARQVGKSTAVRHLAQSFEYYIEINFDEQVQFQKLFANATDVHELLEQLSILTQTPILDGKTLIFLDEIQASLPAISLLRYFYEKRPNLHVIAAGSLLEFALAELPSFGVGRVRSVFMYPFSFSEFLVALNEKPLLNFMLEADPKQPLSDIFHEKLKLYLKKFFIIGGMPEAVQAYIFTGDFLEVQRILDDLVISIQADFVKYKKQLSPANVKEVFDSVVLQSGKKFKYASTSSSIKIPQVKQALEVLQMAGLVYPVVHSSSNGVPLGAEINPKKSKIILFDTGIYQRLLGLDISSLLLLEDADVVNKGSIAELFVGLEILKLPSCYERTTLYYWHRESKNSQAEVDYVVSYQDLIVPLEVKAGTKGAMQSMYLFMQEKKSKLGIRISLENFGQFDHIKVLPMYALSKLPHIIKNK